MKKYRKDFLILKRKIHGKPLVYFDNAATTQKPRQVIDAIKKYYEKTNANIHRGIHMLSEEATAQYEAARAKIAHFIGANDPSEIVFIRNATEGINLIAQSFFKYQVSGIRYQVLLTEMEHHSNLVPWHLLQQDLNRNSKTLHLQCIPVKRDGTLDYSTLQRLVTRKTKLVSVTHASNVFGTINNIPRIVRVAQKKGAAVLVDAAQSVPHLPIDVQKLGCDFLVFSGHKMLGPTGIGVLWGRRELLETMPPFLGGGDMIRSVWYDGFESNDIPWKFEAGTPNIAGAIGFGAAIDYLEKVGMQKIRKHEIALTHYALQKMRRIPGIKIYGPQDPKNQTGVLSFNLNDVHAHDLATVLDQEGIAIRAGHMCAEPLVRKFGEVAMARVSFYFYNTKEEVDVFIRALEKAREIFKI